MTVSLKHAFTSAVADGADASLVRPSNWNAEHTLTLAADRLLGRRTSDGAAEEVTSSQALDFIGSTHGQIVYRGAAAWAALAPGTSRQVLRTGGASANPEWSDQSFSDPRNRFYAFTDCISAVVTDHWDFRGTGTGAALTAIAVAAVNAMGLLRFDLGTTTTGRASIAASAGQTHHKLGSGRSRFQAKLAINQLSNGTDTWSARVGFHDSLTTESTDAAFFRYTDSVNGGKWEAVTRSNGSETASDTGVTPVAGTYQRFSVDVNAGGTSVAFSIDGVEVVTPHTTNIPTGSGRELNWGVLTNRSAGTAALPALVADWVEVDLEFTTQR